MILEIRGVTPMFYSIKVTLLSDIFLSCLRWNTSYGNGY